MGKNQAYKAMQWARLGSSSGASRRRGGRRHEWHAVRLVSLNKTHTLTWEEFKKEKSLWIRCVMTISGQKIHYGFIR
uniref:Uncharacterized protein n=1 Tax=Aegilops tauschii subsp. strangulata TaxID=200361 RepID=A0A453FGS5_AEGTS